MKPFWMAVALGCCWIGPACAGYFDFDTGGQMSPDGVVGAAGNVGPGCDSGCGSSLAQNSCCKVPRSCCTNLWDDYCESLPPCWSFGQKLRQLKCRNCQPTYVPSCCGPFTGLFRKKSSCSCDTGCGISADLGCSSGCAGGGDCSAAPYYASPQHGASVGPSAGPEPTPAAEPAPTAVDEGESNDLLNNELPTAPSATEQYSPSPENLDAEVPAPPSSEPSARRLRFRPRGIFPF